VEDETLACGTGAVSVATASHYHGYLDKDATSCSIKMPGGDLKVEFTPIGDKKYKDIWLTGPAIKVYEGAYKEDVI
jgi:diaminopimelate epimerase